MSDADLFFCLLGVCNADRICFVSVFVRVGNPRLNEEQASKLLPVVRPFGCSDLADLVRWMGRVDELRRRAVGRFSIVYSFVRLWRYGCRRCEDDGGGWLFSRYA